MLYDFELTGRMPLLMNPDNIEFQDTLSEYYMTEEGKKLKKAGDDRVPAWAWHGRLYHDGEHLCLPSDNLIACLGTAGKNIKVNNKQIETETQGGLYIHEENMILKVAGKPIPLKAIHRLRDLKFSQQAEAVKKLGFRLFVKPCVPNGKRHIRVRPAFDDWTLAGTIEVLAEAEEIITSEVLGELFAFAGPKVGLGDWRVRPRYPRRPGRFGAFDARLQRSKKRA